MANPFLIYIISFLTVILFYAFGWSDAYPGLTWTTIMFFILTFVICGFAWAYTRKKKIINYVDAEYSNNLIYVTILIILGNIAEFIYFGSIPIFSKKINYLEFRGIPTFHVILYTFTIFFAVYLYHVYISTRKKIVILLYLICLIPSVLLISRGMFMNIFLGCFFVTLLKVDLNLNFYKKNITKFIILFLAMFYFFGVFGNYRNNTLNKSEEKFSSNYILEVGEASQRFKKSIIPKPFFWAYIYISSPLANLQLNIDKTSPQINTNNLMKFVGNEIVPDFLSKRFFSKTDVREENAVLLIKPELTVGSFYLGAFHYLGWAGVAILFLYLIGICYFYITLLSKSNMFAITGVAMLCNIVALSTFSNILSFSGMSFQLCYPLIFEGILVFKRKYKRKYKRT
ncbi:oligosaccharide repeat unit polymerase [Clostridium sp. CF011]|uniref:O-antigen polymerase n=1 Tax=Clostridium sp. CF011 TaxID=2843318 RepID=UPI001C0C5C97|nr:O-antigen polymerase [Clostridium sp. CF011]MBU3091664.1 oligosaccharide repeat unit polymerase [Clostridium sp. CF011]WAG69376.1 oligosaccharide repeat unit polymerase [Clostridium sp. CF011]